MVHMTQNTNDWTQCPGCGGLPYFDSNQIRCRTCLQILGETPHTPGKPAVTEEPPLPDEPGPWVRLESVDRDGNPTPRVAVIPLKNSPELSRRIGYLAAQQRRAYNQSVEWLNREPRLALMKGKETPRHLSLQGRISELRDPQSPKFDLTWTPSPHCPRWVQNAGAALAFRAQKLFTDARRQRLQETSRIEDRRHWWAANPPDTPEQWVTLLGEERRYAQLSKQHRRTLNFRTRKRGTQTLEVPANQLFSITRDRMSVWIGSPKTDGVRVPLQRPLPKDGEVRSLRLVELRRERLGLANRPLESIRYEVHAAIRHPAVPPAPSATTIQDVMGFRLGTKDSLTTSDAGTYRNDGPHTCKCPRVLPRYPGRKLKDRHHPKCRFARPLRLQARITAKTGGSARRRTSKRRNRLERQRRELLRMRTEDRRRTLTHHIQRALDDRNAPVRLVALPNLNVRRMTQSPRGNPQNPGAGTARKTERNRLLAEASLSEFSNIIVKEAHKRGIKTVLVDARNTATACSACGHAGPKKSTQPPANRRRFECTACGWSGDDATNQAAVLASRAYRQQAGPAAVP